MIALALICVAAAGCGTSADQIDFKAAAEASKRDSDVILALDEYDPWFLLSAEGRVIKLRLTDRHITPEALAEVNKLSALESLNLSRTDLTNEGLAQVKDLQKLKDIHINNTAMTDEGLVHLKNFKNLKEIGLLQGRKQAPFLHTDEGVDKLRADLPKVRVF